VRRECRAAGFDVLRHVFCNFQRPIYEAFVCALADCCEHGAVQMALDAADEIAADHRAFSPREARAAAAKRWRTEDRPPRSTVSKAKAIWRDVATYPTIPEAMAHPDCKGWTQAALYKTFGRRYPPSQGRGGRPKKS
jgi:hypothetical protein